MFRRHKAFSVVILLSLIVAALAQTTPPKSAEKSAQKPLQKNASLENLAWLAGCWEGRQGEAVSKKSGQNRPAGRCSG